MVLGSITISSMVKNSKKKSLNDSSYDPILLIFFNYYFSAAMYIMFVFFCVPLFRCLLDYLESYLSTPLWNFVFVCMRLTTSICEYCSCVMDRPLMMNSDSSCCFLLCHLYY